MKQTLIRMIALTTFLVGMIVLTSYFGLLSACVNCSSCVVSSCNSCDEEYKGTREDYPYISYGRNTFENEKYILISEFQDTSTDLLYCYFINKEKNDIFEISYNSYYDIDSIQKFTYKYEFAENGFKQYSIDRVPKYNVDTGIVSYYEYYKLEILFNDEAKEIERIRYTELLSEEQVNEIMSSVVFVSNEDGFDIYDGFWQMDYYVDDLSESKKAIYKYGEETTNSQEEHQFRTSIITKEINGTTYFSISYCNKNIFWSAIEDFRGVYNSSFGYYDSANKKIEILHTVEKEEMIVFFNEKSIITLNTNNQIHIYDTEIYEKKLIGTFEKEKEVKYIVPLENGMLMYNEEFLSSSNCHTRYYIYISDTGEILFEQIKQTEWLYSRKRSRPKSVPFSAI